MALQPKSILARARTCIRIEGDALAETSRGLGKEFVDTVHAVQKTIASGNKVIFTGVGKSAHIAQKLTGTFNSTGVSSTFLDATQALHGDLGLCAEGDLAILLSNSGQTEEILRLVPVLKRMGVMLVAFTGNADSDLTKNATYRLLYRVPREACPLALAPTASTTAALALGDALAMVLLEEHHCQRITQRERGRCACGRCERQWARFPRHSVEQPVRGVFRQVRIGISRERHQHYAHAFQDRNQAEDFFRLATVAQ